jgi:hypothetical protein
MINMNLKQFTYALEKALIEWRTRQTIDRESVSLNVFASHLGFSRPIISQWLDNDKLPSKGTAEIILPKLIELVGDEIYDILEMPRPDPDLKTLTRIWPHLSEEARHTLREEGERYITENEQPSARSLPMEKTT